MEQFVFPWKIHFLATCVILTFTLSTATSDAQTRTNEFKINYKNNTFEKNGEAFRYVSGSFHYSRVHPFYWQDRLKKMRAAGLNAVQTYVPWNVHEISPGQYKWDGMSDLGKFLQLSKQEGLVVLLRLGPYICGEWEFGGFPAWLLRENPNMILRTSDPSYMEYVTCWFKQLLPRVKPFLFNNGGPVVMVQIENEYGSYFAVDRKYMIMLRDMVTEVLGTDVVIYTTDGSGDYFLSRGKTPNVYATVDFGVTYNASHSFQPQRDYEPQGPLVNSEFYTGWLDHWGDPHSRVDTTKIAKSLDILLAYNSSSINMYMYIGGTNFGYMNGANEPPYQPVPTSYDYDSPVSEAGDIGDKFYAIRDVVSKYLPLPKTPIPSNTTKMNYGTVPMTFVSTVQDALPYLCVKGPVPSQFPISMEMVNFYGGFIMYRHVLKSDVDHLTTLTTWATRDRAIVMVDRVPQGILNREINTTVNITGKKNSILDILVENQGRVGFSTDMNFNRKGLIANISLGGEILEDWLIYPINTDAINTSLSSLIEHRKSYGLQNPLKSVDGKLMTPSIYMGDIRISPGSKQQFEDTFFDPLSFTKGQAFVNDFNLGRYWPRRGPQVRLFVPKPLFSTPSSNSSSSHSLSSIPNRLFLFELENAPCVMNQFTFDNNSGCETALVDKPYLDGPNGPDTLNANLNDVVKGKKAGYHNHINKEINWDSSFHKYH